MFMAITQRLARTESFIAAWLSRLATVVAMDSVGPLTGAIVKLACTWTSRLDSFLRDSLSIATAELAVLKKQHQKSTVAHLSVILLTIARIRKRSSAKPAK